MGSSVTPQAGITARGEELKGWKRLACGVDSLDLAGWIDWRGCWAKLGPALQEGKASAQAADKPLFWADTACGPLLITPKGKPPMYRFHLQGRDEHWSKFSISWKISNLGSYVWIRKRPT